MAKSGPQRYPGASTAYWYQSRYPGSAMETNVIVWHSTEGTSLPSYSGGANAPNLTAVPDFAAQRLRWYQHFDFDTSARALRNLGGGVETNTLNVCQIEVVGTCDPTAHRKWGMSRPHLYMPELPDWAVRDLAAFAQWAHERHGVPLVSGLAFKPYPASYGTNGVRMSGARWRSFKGHCGHQHVPENDHGDPGAFPMAAILARAAGGSTTAPTPTSPEQEDDVPISDEDAKRIARQVALYKDSRLDARDARQMWDDAASPHHVWQFRQRPDGPDAWGLLTGLTAQVGALTATVAQLAAGGGLDASEIQAAAEAGARAALAELGERLTNDRTEP